MVDTDFHSSLYSNDLFLSNNRNSEKTIIWTSSVKYHSGTQVRKCGFKFFTNRNVHRCKENICSSTFIIVLNVRRQNYEWWWLLTITMYSFQIGHGVQFILLGLANKSSKMWNHFYSIVNIVIMSNSYNETYLYLYIIVCHLEQTVLSAC